MKPKVYVETTIISYLTSRPSRDLIVAAHQQVTRDWWEFDRSVFDVHVSEAVVQEAKSGDEAAARRRLQAIEEIPILRIDARAGKLAETLLRRRAVPPNAETDALHIAISASHEMDYLLTWNLAHMANAQTRNLIANIIRQAGCDCPIICTPEELRRND